MRHEGMGAVSGEFEDGNSSPSRCEGVSEQARGIMVRMPSLVSGHNDPLDPGSPVRRQAGEGGRQRGGQIVVADIQFLRGENNLVRRNPQTTQSTQRLVVADAMTGAAVTAVGQENAARPRGIAREQRTNEVFVILVREKKQIHGARK
jgi:hypothetical protein